jgi:hypothetical protein
MLPKIDLSNPEEVTARMPELVQLYEAKREEQRVLNDTVELLRRIVELANGVSRGRLLAAGAAQGEPPERSERPRRRRAAPAQDRAVEALEAAHAKLGGTALGPTSLHKFMLDEGMEAPRDAGLLGTNLHDAWNAGRIMRAPNGVYTPLDGSGRREWDRPLTDYYYAAECGFPIPGSWPPAVPS